MAEKWRYRGFASDGKVMGLLCAVLHISHYKRVIVNKVISSGIGKSAKNDAYRKMYKLSLKSSVCT